MPKIPRSQETRPMNIDYKMLKIFRKEGGDENNCPKSITLEMLADATGAELKPRLNDAGIHVKIGNKLGLWYAYYKTTLSSMIFAEDYRGPLDFGGGNFSNKEEKPILNNSGFSFPNEKQLKARAKKRAANTAKGDGAGEMSKSRIIK